MEYPRALRKTISEGGKITLFELKHFLKKRNSSNYMAILKTIKDHGSLGSTWSEAKRGAEARLKHSLNNKTVTDTLVSLVEEEILEKIGNNYKIIDPLLEEVSKPSQQ